MKPTWPPRRAQEGSQKRAAPVLVAKTPQEASKSPLRDVKRPSRGAQERPKTAQEAPKRGPRGPQERPKRFQDGPKWPPREAQEAPRSPRVAPRYPEIVSRRAKTGPRGSKMLSRSSRETQKRKINEISKKKRRTPETFVEQAEQRNPTRTTVKLTV